MAQPQSISDLRWLLVLALYIESLLFGAVQVLAERSAAPFFAALLVASTAALWTVFDARRLHRPILHVMQFFVFAFWPIAVPIYLVRTRGIRGFGWAVLHALGLFFAMFVAFVVVWIATYGVDSVPR